MATSRPALVTFCIAGNGAAVEREPSVSARQRTPAGGEAIEACFVDPMEDDPSRAIVRCAKVRRYQDLLDQYGDLDPYAVLGVPFMASKATIRQAYKEVCKKEHPDVNGGFESAEWLMANNAYAILNNGKTRMRAIPLRGASRS
ncbi:unnamed protein product [Prorocentrum cordatum]|uniref:J domain-containing protein n=1 Tax=Prorocentrum cordatum TaxID=2364126 RepID=A0ABN9TY21_9DINO|nr:unnamed protein product [Polarella glacialis]